MRGKAMEETPAFTAARGTAAGRGMKK